MAGKWLLISEKPSQARSWAKALGGMSGTYNGQAYVVTNALGHLYEQMQPQEMVSPDKAEQYGSWDVKYLPWNEADITWKLKLRSGVSDVAKAIRTAANGCDTICFAGDLDPSGEGGVISYEIVKQLHLSAKQYLRLEFSDESPKSLQKAFKNPVPISNIDTWHEVRKALFRSHWDFIGGLQWTRMATRLCGQRNVVLRNGRLKSAIIVIVGDRLMAIKNYVKKPFFQNRFRDENGIVYINPEEPTFDEKSEVPNTYKSSDVVCDSKTMKKTAPPRLIDLAMLAGRLAPMGIKSDTVLSVYQSLYESSVVSYPRTEDKKITIEQFNDLAPKVDAIAAVVGVDPKLLTVRTPRKTHIGDGMAHGANRPGPNVPKSLAELDAKFGKGAGKIYEVLAKSYLAMLCPDYEYEQQKGHVKDYPAFVGSVNVPKVAGWRAVYDDDSEDKDESTKGLGTKADPFVYEGANKKPSQPTIKWLMAQLAKHDIGTGATRTSTVAEITKNTSSKAKFKSQVLKESKGRLSFAECGEMSYWMLKDTHIADLAVTKHVQDEMELVAKGKLSEADGLHEIQHWILDDIDTMRENAKKMQAELGLTSVASVDKEYAEGTFNGETIKFSRVWAGHRFTDAEVADLLAGKEITVLGLKSQSGTEYGVKGKLEKQKFKGKTFWGFSKTEFVNADGSAKAQTNSDDYAEGTWKRKKIRFKRIWGGHRFTDAEVADLLAGKEITVTGLKSKSGTEYGVTGKLANLKFNGVSYVGFDKTGFVGADGKAFAGGSANSADYAEGDWNGKHVRFKKVFRGKKLTAAQVRSLLAGKEVTIKDLKSKSGKSYNCVVKLADLEYNGRKYVGLEQVGYA